jgi:hypothetical protein
VLKIIVIALIEPMKFSKPQKNIGYLLITGDTKAMNAGEHITT